MALLSKADLIDEVAERTGESKAATSRLISALQDVIVETVAAGDEVRLTGFASFAPHTRAARTYRNPQTGESIESPATRTVSIKPGSKFKEVVKNS